MKYSGSNLLYNKQGSKTVDVGKITKEDRVIESDIELNSYKIPKTNQRYNN